MLDWLAFTGGISLTDLALKHYFSHGFEIGDEKQFAGGNVILTKYENEGAMMGILKDSQEELKLFSSVALGMVTGKFFYLIKSGGCFLEKLGLALVSAGAISNVGERFLRGSVTDYFRFPKIKFIKDIVFNIGDIAIFAGFILTTIAQVLKLFKKNTKNT